MLSCLCFALCDFVILRIAGFLLLFNSIIYCRLHPCPYAGSEYPVVIPGWIDMIRQENINQVMGRIHPEHSTCVPGVPKTLRTYLVG